MTVKWKHYINKGEKMTHFVKLGLKIPKERIKWQLRKKKKQNCSLRAECMALNVALKRVTHSGAPGPMFFNYDCEH